MAKFKRKDYVKELNRELKMRRQVWRQIPGMPENFSVMEQQRQYDILSEIRDILDTISDKSIKDVQDETESIQMMIQCSQQILEL